MGLNPGEGHGSAMGCLVHAKSYVPKIGSLETRPCEHGPPEMAYSKCCVAGHSYGHASFPSGPELRLKVQLDQSFLRNINKEKMARLLFPTGIRSRLNPTSS